MEFDAAGMQLSEFGDHVAEKFPPKQQDHPIVGEHFRVPRLFKERIAEAIATAPRRKASGAHKTFAEALQLTPQITSDFV